MGSSLPRLIVTGASGFVGRHLLDALKNDYQIVGLARRSQAASGAPVHPNITWHQVDIGEAGPLAQVFRAIRDPAGGDIVIHLAAHYDFTGDYHSEYWRTNVVGLRNVLDQLRERPPRRLLFPSSTAACRFPPPGKALDEESPPDGEHIYAETKGLAEHLLRTEYASVPSLIVRFAALFSDWCEYAPLYVFLTTWLGKAWNRRILGGRGQSAIPYLHIADGVRFVRTALRRLDDLPTRSVLLASPDGATTHRELFEAATLHAHGERARPLLVPRALCVPGIALRDLAGRVLGERPFERLWMVRYIDLRMTVDAGGTRARLGWAPRERLSVLRRLPFMLENMKSEALEWKCRNHAAMKEVRLRPQLRIHALLKHHERTIGERLEAAVFGPAAAERFAGHRRLHAAGSANNVTLALRHLIEAIGSGERTAFSAYCRDLAGRRRAQGVTSQELCALLQELDVVCRDALLHDAQAAGLEPHLNDNVGATLRWGRDEVQDVYERMDDG